MTFGLLKYIFLGPWFWSWISFGSGFRFVFCIFEWRLAAHPVRLPPPSCKQRWGYNFKPLFLPPRSVSQDANSGELNTSQLWCLKSIRCLFWIPRGNTVCSDEAAGEDLCRPPCRICRLPPSRICSADQSRFLNAATTYFPRSQICEDGSSVFVALISWNVILPCSLDPIERSQMNCKWRLTNMRSDTKRFDGYKMSQTGILYHKQQAESTKSWGWVKMEKWPSYSILVHHQHHHHHHCHHHHPRRHHHHDLWCLPPATAQLFHLAHAAPVKKRGGPPTDHLEREWW